MIHRIEVQTAPGATPDGADPEGRSVRQQAREMGIELPPVRTARIFLIDSDADSAAMLRVAGELLADPVVETAALAARPPDDGGRARIEVHLKPGVMDPVAASTRMAIRDMGLDVSEVRTGRAYIIDGPVDRATLERFATRVLANPVIENIHYEAFLPERFPSGQQYALCIRRVPLRDLDEQELAKLSREAHLFLSPAEMKAIQDYYRAAGREPTDVELETLAQTWSEHCVHKTLKSAVDLELRDAQGRVLARRSYDNLIRDTIFGSTMELMDRAAAAGRPPLCLSVFADNAGVIAFDEQYAVCFKVETHNHPSAIEPYGGSATGIGGVIRDVLGTGLGARPVANTDVFCVAFADDSGGPAPRGDAPQRRLPRGVLHPRRILRQVVAGVRDYGNRMGIPTVNGAVFFDERYLGNPLVFCGCVGIIPRDMISKQARDGDLIVLVGGRTGRDGIHGATFSSAELTDTHADEFSHAVQIGNAIEEKRMADVVLQARDRGLFTAITDCGAGGLSSAVGEMGRHLGACVDLEKVPLKYAGLRYDEIWISEAQERMVLAVPPDKADALLALAKSEDVEATVIGRFGAPDAHLILRYEGTEVGRLSMDFLHEGLPRRRVSAVAVIRGARDAVAAPPPEPAALKERLLEALAHPNVASRHWIIRQYDHEVQGGSVIKPLVGPLQQGPGDAAVLRPRLDSMRGVVIACGLAPHVEDPYEMALAAIDEAVRNVVAVGGDLSTTALLDNFCWPSVDGPRAMGDLVRACEGCRDAALAWGIPFISGKDSLNNQFVDQETGQVIRIPDTLLISAISVVADVRRCITPDLKSPGAPLLVVGPRRREAGLFDRLQVHRLIAASISAGLVASCHDISDGGGLAAVAEMIIASGLGAEICSPDGRWWFDESPARYVVELAGEAADPSSDARCRWRRMLDAFEACELAAGSVLAEPLLRVRMGDGAPLETGLEEMRRAWLGTLDW